MADRDIRQRDILPSEKLKKLVAAVVGVGAVGHQVARMLAAMGVGKILLIDPDTVDVENLAAQGFTEAQLGARKVDAVREECAALNSEIEIKHADMKFAKRHLMDVELDDDLVVFACVDDMEARKQIYNAALGEGAVFIDGRMAAEVFTIYCVRNEEDAKHYEKSLFSNDEMFQASCTAKTTLYCANVIAGMIVAQFSKYLRGIPTPKEMEVNIVTGSISYPSVEEEEPDEA